MSSLPKGWIETKLKELVTIKGGKRLPKGKTLISKKTKHPYIRITDLENNSIKKEQLQFITDDIFSNISRYIVKTDDVILSIVGTIGLVSLIDDDLNDANLTENCVKLSVLNTEILYYEYLFYYLISKNGQYEINKNSVGAVQKKLPIYGVENINIKLPEIDEQKAIANILSSFDKKIELLKEQNQTLETMAGAIFKEWFVDFNYPNATGEMIDSEMGEIPKGWRVGKLGDEFDVTIGRTPPRKESKWFSEVPQGMKWASIKDMRNAGVYIFNTSEYIVDEAIAKFNIPIIPENTAILSFKMTVGKVSITTEKMLSNEAIAHMKIKKDSYLTSEYIYLFLLNLNFNTLGSTSSIVTAINTAIIKKIKFLVPDKISMNNFNNLIIPIFKKIKTNSSQIQTLEETRDSLLPKLMSGEVRVNA